MAHPIFARAVFNRAVLDRDWARGSRVQATAETCSLAGRPPRGRAFLMLGPLALGAVLLGAPGASAASQAAPPVQSQAVQSTPPVPGAPQTVALPVDAAQNGAAPAPKPLTPGQQADLQAAQAALSGKDYRAARARFEALTAARYDSPEAHFGLGLALYNLGDLKGAKFELGQFVKLAPERAEGYYDLGVVAARAGQSGEALSDYAKALDLARGKASPDLLIRILSALAAEQTRGRDYPALAATLTERLALDPDNDTVRLDLARATFGAGQGPEALPLAYAVFSKNPKNAEAALLIADIYAAQDLQDRAVRELSKAIAAATSGPIKAKLLLRRAELQQSQNLPKDAALSLRAAASADPGNAGVQARLGELLFARGDLGGAQSAWRAAVWAEPKNAVFRANLASAQLARGDLAGARASALRARKDAAAADAATLARANFVLGVIAYKAGKFAEARAALETASAKAPGAEASLWLGLSRYALKDYAGAVSALEDSVRIAPTVSARANLGAALLAAERYPEAEVTLRGVIADAPKNAEAWYQLGWSVKSQGKDSQARQAFKAALKLGYAKAKGEVLR